MFYLILCHSFALALAGIAGIWVSEGTGSANLGAATIIGIVALIIPVYTVGVIVTDIRDHLGK